jgi:hypothetical protein
LLETETPDGISYHTPENENEIMANLDFDGTLIKHFMTTQAITTIQGFLPLDSLLPDETPHMHQIGVFGLAHTCNHLQRQDAAQLLFRAQSFGRNLLEIIRNPSETFVQPSSRDPVLKRPRKAKVWISASDKATFLFKESSKGRIMYQLKHSDFCHQILGLSQIDRVLWKQPWAPMSDEEGRKLEGTGRTFFGDPVQHYPRTSFLNIFVLMASEKGGKNTIFLRMAIGLGEDVPLSCKHCERDVIAVDAIRATGALQLNVPLRYPGSILYESSEIIESTGVETGKWSERVGYLKGWWPCCFTKPLRDWDPMDECVDIVRDKPFDLGIWDPDAKMEPAMGFQPYAQEEQNVCHSDWVSINHRCASNDFEPRPLDESFDPDGKIVRELDDDDDTDSQDE